MAVSEKLLEKINNLFKLAEGNSNANEAQNALLMAQKLMAQNGIESSEIHQILKPKEVLQQNITELGRLAWWEKQLGQVVAKNFRCEIYIHKAKSGGTIVFLGLKDDVNLAKIVYTFASDAIIREASKWMKSYNKNHITLGTTAGIKNDFIRGWVKGLESKYQEQVNQNGWGLVLVKDPLVQQELNKLHLRKGHSSAVAKGSASSGAYSNGYERGKSFNSPMGALT